MKLNTNGIHEKNSFLTSDKIKLPFALFFTAITVMLCMVIGCSNESSLPTINLWELPNSVTENSQVSDQYSEISKSISKDVFDEFIDITKIPHTSGHLNQISSYVSNKINEYGSNATTDAPSGCIYADIPATNKEEYKNKPVVILQAHLDMVGVADKNYTNFDPNTMAVEAIYDESNHTIHSKDFKTNIGADDGCGVAFMLAALKNQNNFDHGPIRLLFTTEEETTFEGAINLTPSVLNAPYLINLDGFQIGNLRTTSAGTLTGEYTKNYDQIPPDSTESLLSLEVSNLVGGHTGADVTKQIMHPSAYMLQMFEMLQKNNIEFKISEITCGSVKNAYATGFNIALYVKTDQLDKIKTCIKDNMDQYKQNLKDENDFSFKLTVSNNNNQTSLTKEDTNKFVSFIKTIPEGVMVEGQLLKNIPETSCSSAVLNIKDGLYRMTVMLRSSNNDTLNEYKDKLGTYGNGYGIDYTETMYSPAWSRDPNNKLCEIMLNSYNEVGKFNGIETATHGGLETAYFVQKNPNLKMISIGLDYSNEHTVKETIYTDTLDIHVATVLYTLQHID